MHSINDGQCQNGQGQNAKKQAMGGGQSNQVDCKLKCRDGQKKSQDPVLDGLCRTIAVEFYFGGDRFFAVGCKSNELMDGAEGAYPAAKKPAQNDG